MDSEDTFYTIHGRHLEEEDEGIKDLSLKYLTHLDENQVDYDYGGNFKPKAVKHKKRPHQRTIPPQPLYQADPEAASLDWNHLRTFYYAATAGSFIKAETYLNVSQSAITRTIQNLEKYLGEELFVRSGRGLALTPVGRSILKGMSQSIVFFESLRSHIRQDRHQRQGDIYLHIDQATIGFIRPVLPGITRVHQPIF